MTFDPQEYARQTAARFDLTISDADVERIAAFFGPRPGRKLPASASEPQLVQVPERWRQS